MIVERIETKIDQLEESLNKRREEMKTELEFLFSDQLSVHKLVILNEIGSSKGRSTKTSVKKRKNIKNT